MFWSTHVVPRMVDLMLGERVTGELRDRVCAGLSGTVLEIGFGSGLNAPHYPAAVTDVLAVEPSDVGWRLAQPRLGRTPVPVRRVGLDGQSLPLPDDAADTALSTWTLCTIPDAGRALAEVRRVLKPGGTLHFVEHGRAESPRVQAWQDRLNPVQQRIAGGCNLNRPIADLLTGAGFVLDRLDAYDAPGGPKPFSWFYEGVARAA